MLRVHTPGYEDPHVPNVSRLLADGCHNNLKESLPDLLRAHSLHNYKLHTCSSAVGLEMYVRHVRECLLGPHEPNPLFILIWRDDAHVMSML